MIDDPAGTSDDIPAQRSAAPRIDPWQVHIGPLVLWLIVQLIALALSAARVPLWARAPDPIERLALEQLAVVQLIVAALVFPWMLRNFATSAAVILTAAPMLQLAAMLAQASAQQTILAWAYVSAWLACGAMWASALRCASSRAVAVAVAVAVSGALVIGGPVVRYLAAEFSVDSSARAWGALGVDPVTALVRQLSRSSVDARGWMLVTILSLAAIALRMFHRARSAAPSYPQE